MSLRADPAEFTSSLPDGREVIVRVGVADDPYIPRRELDTVVVEVVVDGQVAAALNTVLDVAQESEARELGQEITAGLESGRLEPTAGAIEPLADTLR